MHVKFYRIFKIKYVHVILSSGWNKSLPKFHFCNYYNKSTNLHKYPQAGY